MIDLLRVYICMKCGDVLSDEVSLFDDIDTENDDVEVYWLHDKCGHSAVPKTATEDGKRVPVYEQVDHERWLWSTGFYDETTEDEGESI
jgi:hypothetical protein